MLGRRDPQQSLFSAQNLSHRVPADSFYGRMAAVSDDDLKELYCPDNGRPSLSPSLMSGVLLMYAADGGSHDDVSGEEAVQRLMFDFAGR